MRLSVGTLVFKVLEFWGKFGFAVLAIAVLVEKLGFTVLAEKLSFAVSAGKLDFSVSEKT